MRLRIGHLNVAVRLFKTGEPEHDRWGDYGDCEQEIRLAGASPERQLATLLHEIVHAAWDAYGVRTKINEEQTAAFIGASFASLIINNPHLLPVLTALAGGATFQQENSDG